MIKNSQIIDIIRKNAEFNQSINIYWRLYSKEEMGRADPEVLASIKKDIDKLEEEKQAWLNKYISDN